MADSMVLLQIPNSTPLPNMEPEENEFGDVEDDYSAVASAITRMNERENSYVLKQINGRNSPSKGGRNSPTKGKLTPRSIGTPRTPRSQFISTPRSHTLLGTNATVLNENVPLTQRNSAISSGYRSPRQFTLSASHMDRAGSGLPPRLGKLHEPQRKMSFDYDPNEGTLSRSTIKPTKWPVRPAKTHISLGIGPVWSEPSLSAWRNIGSLSTQMSAQRSLWSNWADVQAESSLGAQITLFVLSCSFVHYIYWKCTDYMQCIIFYCVIALHLKERWLIRPIKCILTRFRSARITDLKSNTNCLHIPTWKQLRVRLSLICTSCFC